MKSEFELKMEKSLHNFLSIRSNLLNELKSNEDSIYEYFESLIGCKLKYCTKTYLIKKVEYLKINNYPELVLEEEGIPKFIKPFVADHYLDLQQFYNGIHLGNFQIIEKG